MEVFQVQSPSQSTTSAYLDLQGLLLHRGCWAGTHCPVISPLLRSPQEPRATQHPRANHTEVTELGAGVTQVSAGMTQVCAIAREGRNPHHSPVPGNCYTLELTVWKSPSINGIKHLVLPGKGMEKLLPSPPPAPRVPVQPGWSRERERRTLPAPKRCPASISFT